MAVAVQLRASPGPVPTTSQSAAGRVTCDDGGCEAPRVVRNGADDELGGRGQAARGDQLLQAGLPVQAGPGGGGPGEQLADEVLDHRACGLRAVVQVGSPDERL